MSRTPAPEIALPEPLAFLDDWSWRQPRAAESTSAWLARTDRQREALMEATASWLRVGQAVRVNADPRAGGGEHAGKIGTITRLCGKAFADYTIVRFEPVGRQTVARTPMLPLEVLEPAESGS